MLDAAGGWGDWKGLEGNKCVGIYTMGRITEGT